MLGWIVHECCFCSRFFLFLLAVVLLSSVCSHFDSVFTLFRFRFVHIFILPFLCCLLPSQSLSLSLSLPFFYPFSWGRFFFIGSGFFFLFVPFHSFFLHSFRVSAHSTAGRRVWGKTVVWCKHNLSHYPKTLFFFSLMVFAVGAICHFPASMHNEATVLPFHRTFVAYTANRYGTRGFAWWNFVGMLLESKCKFKLMPIWSGQKDGKRKTKAETHRTQKKERAQESYSLWWTM